MKLQILAQQYKKFFLDVEYHIYTEREETIILKGEPENFLHLTGLQQCLSPKIDATKFYFDCLNGKYNNIENLLSRINNNEIRNTINIKICYFSNLQNAIMSSTDLYFDNNKNYGICSLFMTKGNIKFHTLIFKYDKRLGFCIPKSNQIDISKEYSNVIKHQYKSEPIAKIDIIKR